MKQIDGQKMRDIAAMIDKELKGLGFALITFEMGDGPRMSNYISNAQREGMIEALDETVKRLKSKQDFKTPNLN